jgi:hypothetical protein
MSPPEPKPGTIRLFNTADLYARADEAAVAARSSFVAFRRIIRPDMLWGWWVEQISLELEHFYAAMVAGKRPRLAIMTPPQHGKSSAAEDFAAWVAGKNPDLKTIYASYSDGLGTQRNANLRRLIRTPRYRHIFGNTNIGSTGWRMNSSVIEYVGHSGSFRNTTVGGPITGMEQNLGVIDDPVKGRAEAMSKTIRDGTWNWFSDDFRTRFAADNALLVVMTRWHDDDLVGRLMRKQKIRKLIYPAIAVKDDGFRRQGEALFPALKPLDFLLEQKNMMSMASWEAEYQQNPIIPGGGIFPIDKLSIVPVFDRSQIAKSVRAWDKAGTAGGDGAYTAGVLMHKMNDGTFFDRGRHPRTLGRA